MAIRHSPVTRAETGTRNRGPNLSTSRPRKAPEAPPDREREVVSQPKRLREIPRSLPIGMMKRPRFRVPIAPVAKFTREKAATMTQP